MHAVGQVDATALEPMLSRPPHLTDFIDLNRFDANDGSHRVVFQPRVVVPDPGPDLRYRA